MSAIPLAPTTAPRRLRRQRRLEHPYPLFGFRTQVYRIPLANRHTEIDRWLLQQMAERPEETWQARWQRCQQELRGRFKELWVVHLPRQSRWLKPGSYVFDPLTDFLHIPGTPPQSVCDGYAQAFAELPRHRFVYLDLLWESTATGLRLASIAGLQARVDKLQQQFQRRLRQDHLLVQAAQQRQAAIIARLDPRRASTVRIPLISTPTEARRVLGLSQSALEQSLRVQLGVMDFTKFDPMIVFEEPALLKRAGGNMPLGLVAHWD